MAKYKQTENGLQLSDDIELQVFTGDLANTKVSKYVSATSDRAEIT